MQISWFDEDGITHCDCHEGYVDYNWGKFNYNPVTHECDIECTDEHAIPTQITTIIPPPEFYP